MLEGWNSLKQIIMKLFGWVYVRPFQVTSGMWFHQNKNNLGHSLRFYAYHSQDIPKFCYLPTNWAFYKLLFLVHDGGGGYIGGEEIEQKGISQREKEKWVIMDFSLNLHFCYIYIAPD